MTQQRSMKIKKQQWDKAAADYELGSKNGAQIARELGVSPAAVSREFKRRGCTKGCRVAETQVELVKQLNEKARRRAVMQTAREKAALERSAVIDEMIGEMVRSIVAAAKAGDLSAAAPVIEKAGKSLGVKLAR
jgi:predicted transcriptional regulator